MVTTWISKQKKKYYYRASTEHGKHLDNPNQRTHHNKH